MKIIKLFVAVGLAIGVIGFLIGVMTGDKELGKSLFLSGFIIIVIGLVSLLFIKQPGRYRSTGLKIIAGGFLTVTLGTLVNFIAPSIDSVGNMFFDVGMAIMFGGILYHLVIVGRGKVGSD